MTEIMFHFLKLLGQLMAIAIATEIQIELLQNVALFEVTVMVVQI